MRIGPRPVKRRVVVASSRAPPRLRRAEHPHGSAVLSIPEARGLILSGLRPTGAETVPLAAADGRVLAHAIRARLDQPAHDQSAMDGYALRAADGAEGAVLRVIGEAPAGRPFDGAVRPGEALRLFTGSVMPTGADAVLIQENATSDGDHLRVDRAVERGRHVRLRGGDFASGEVLIEPGRLLDARLVGLAAAANHPHLAVRRRPRIALLATGDEVVLPGEPIGAGGLPSSNSFALAAAIRRAGGDPVTLPVAPDDLAAIAAIAAEAASCDMLVTTGGASVGDHDLVRPALARLGFEPDVWRIAMRPGKPLMHGALRFGDHAVPVLGLPGNPVSTLVCAALFLLPAIAAMLGRDPEAALSPRPVRVATMLPANDGRADHLRASLVAGSDGVPLATPFPVQDSGRLADLARADALILRSPHAPSLASGGRAEALILAELGI